MSNHHINTTLNFDRQSIYLRVEDNIDHVAVHGIDEDGTPQTWAIMKSDPDHLEKAAEKYQASRENALQRVEDLKAKIASDIDAGEADATEDFRGKIQAVRNQ